MLICISYLPCLKKLEVHDVNRALIVVNMCRFHHFGGLVFSELDSGASGPGSSPGRGHCVAFLGKTLYSHGASLHPGI